MGYLTQFSLQVINEDDSEINHDRNIAVIAGYWDIDNKYDFSFDDSDSIKWYDHEKDMKLYSLCHPELIFELSGEGEESGDVWKKYFKDGKMQACYAIITFEPFDEKKLIGGQSERDKLKFELEQKIKLLGSEIFEPQNDLDLTVLDQLTDEDRKQISEIIQKYKQEGKP